MAGVDEVGYAFQVSRVALRLTQCLARLLVGGGGELSGLFEAEQADIGDFAMTLIRALGLAELLVRTGHVENVVDDLEQDAELVGETPVGDCLRFIESFEYQYDADAGGDQSAGLQRVQGAKL